jgi:lipoate-protein ligase A
MNRERWRFLDSGPENGAGNMGVDEAILEAHMGADAPPTLRVYAWQAPTVSLGRFQEAGSSIDLEACRSSGIGVVRRPTGGRAILHTREEVTFSVVASAALLGTTGVMGSYRAVAGGILAALQALGLEAALVERSGRPAEPRDVRDPACFAVKARCDVEVGGAKLVGSAQVQRKGRLLQQNSLPLTISWRDWGQVFRRAAVPPQASGLWEAANRRVDYAEVAGALRRGFAESFGCLMEEGELTAGERERADELAAGARIL